MKTKPSTKLTHWLSRWISPTENLPATESAPPGGLMLMALEDRVLYSASPLPVDVIDAGVVETVDSLEAIEQHLQEFEMLADTDLDSLISSSSWEQSAADPRAYQFEAVDDLPTLISADPSELNQEPLELIFVDAGVNSVDVLVSDLDLAGRNFEVIQLSAGESGLQEITQQLANYSDVGAIHLVSHASSGVLQAGSDRVTTDSIENFANALSSWRQSTTADADLLIYGCDLTSTVDGQQLVDRLAELTGMDIAASNDLTGHVSLGGDWDLEYQLGAIETSIAFSASATESWTEVLGAASPVAAGLPLSGDQSQDHDVAADYLGNATIVRSSDSLSGAIGKDIYLSRIDVNGNLTIDHQRINTRLNGDQDEVAIAMDDFGNYAVVWTSDVTGTDIVKAKFFSADGTVLADEFQVNLNGTEASHASVAMSDTGRIVVAWQGSGTHDATGVFAKQFDLRGNSVTSVLALNTDTDNLQITPDVAMNSAGDWIVAWHNFETTNDGTDTVFSIYDASGQLVVDNVQAQSNPNMVSSQVDVAIDDSQNFAVSIDLRFRDGLESGLSSSAVMLYLYNGGNWDSTADGTYWTSSTTFNNRDQYNPSVELVGGEAFLAWQGESNDGSDDDGVFYNTIDMNGDEVGTTQSVAMIATEQQTLPQLASFHDDQGTALIWLDENGSNYELKLEVNPTFTNTAPTATDGNLTTLESQAVVILPSDLGYSDAETGLGTLRIDSLPSSGYLIVNGQKVNAGDSILGFDVTDGHLFFVPDSHVVGSDSFTFTVNDGFADAATSNTLTISVNDAAQNDIIEFGNTYTSSTGAVLVNSDDLVGDQHAQDVVGLNDGGYVVVWENETDNSLNQRVYDANGNTVSVGSLTASVSGSHQEPTITALTDGGYLIAWTRTDGGFGQIVFNRYDSSGNVVAINGSTEPQVALANEATTQFGASVAALDHGGWVIAWTTGLADGGDGLDVVARVFDANGGGSNRFRVNDTILGTQRDTVVEALDNNRFVVGWVDQNVNDHDIYAKVFDNGVAVSSEILVNQQTNDRQGTLDLTRLENGNFVATWVSTGGYDGAGRGIFGAVFDESGNRQSGSDLQLNQAFNNHQIAPSVVAENGGGFSVFFETFTGFGTSGDGSGHSIITRSFDDNGAAISDDRLINTMRYGTQESPVAAKLNDGTVVLTYLSADGDQLGVDNADATNDYGYGIYLERLLQTATVKEGATTPIRFGADLIDPSEIYSKLNIKNIPSGILLTDGVNVSSGTSEDIRTWDLTNLSISVAAGTHADFDLQIEWEVDDNGDKLAREQWVRVEVEHVNNPLTQPDLSDSTDEDSPLVLSPADLTSGYSDLDLGTPVENARQSFGYDSPPPVDDGLGNLTWDSSVGGHTLDLDSSGVTFNVDPTETIRALRQHLVFDGTAGGVATFGGGELDDKGAIEVWLKPSSTSNAQLILEYGDSNDGFALIQRGSFIEVVFKANQQTGPTHESYRLTADALSTTEFTQVVLTYGNSAVAGSDVHRMDFQLYINGQLADQIVDVPTFADDVQFNDHTNLGVGEVVSGAVSNDYDQLFAGSIGKLAIFNKELSAEDIETYYLNTLNRPEPVPADGSHFTVGSSATLSSGATVSVDASGNVVYDPNGQFDSLAHNATTTDTFQYRVENGAGDFDTITATISIQGINDAPIIASIPDFTVAEDGTLNGSIAAYVSDPDETGLLEFRKDGNPANGNITFDQDTGDFVYTPDNNFVGSDTINIKIKDSHGDETFGSFVINVTGTNDLPTSANVVINVNEFTTRPIAVSDFVYNDAETSQFDHLEIGVVPTNGSLTLNGSNVGTGDIVTYAQINAGQLVYTDAGANDAFTFRVSDGTALSSATYSVSFVSVDVPEAPSSQSFSRTIAEDTSYAFSFSDLAFSDPDGDSLDHLEIRSLPTSGQLTLNGTTVSVGTSVTRAQLDSGALVFTPGTNEFGSGYSSFDFRVSDGGLESADYTVTFDVTPVNDAPTSSNRTISTLEGTTRTLSVGDFPFTDVESSTFDYIRFVTVPSNGSLDLNGSSVNTGETVSRTDIMAGLLTYTDNFADDSLQFKVSDGTTESTPSYTITLLTDNVPDPPTAQDFSRTINEDGSYAFTVADLGFNSLDGNLLGHVEIRSVPTAGQLTLSGSMVNVGDIVTKSQIDSGLLVYSPNGDEFGTNYASFNFRVNDGVLNSTDYTVTMNVTPVNDLPTSSDATLVVDEGTTRVFSVGDFTFSDVESANLSHVRFTNLPSTGELRLNGALVSTGLAVTYADIDAGLLTYTDGYTDDSLQFRVSDGTAESTGNYTLTLQTNDLPDAPTGQDFVRGLDEDTSYAIIFADLGFADADGDAFAHLTITSAPTQGRLTLGGTSVSVGQTITRSQLDSGLLVFTPSANDFGNGYSSFDFRVNDGGLDSVEYTATFDVLPVNDLPTSSNNIISVDERTTIALSTSDFAYSDLETSQFAEISIESIPTSGTLRLNGVAVNGGDKISYADILAGRLTYTDAEMDDAFRYKVSDGAANSALSYQLGFRSVDLPESPVASDDMATVDEGARARVNVVGNDTLNATGSWTVTIVDGPDYGAARVNSSGEVVYEHDGSETLTDQVTYQITNSDGLSDTAQIRFDVNPLDDMPTVNNDQLTTTFNTAVPLNDATIFSNDVDPDSPIAPGDLVIVNYPSHGYITMANGQLVYQPDSTFSGADQFSYQIQTGTGTSNLATVEVTVSPGFAASAPPPSSPASTSTSSSEDSGSDSDSSDSQSTEDSGDTSSDSSSPGAGSTAGSGGTGSTGGSSGSGSGGDAGLSFSAGQTDDQRAANLKRVESESEESDEIEQSYQIESNSRSYSYSGRTEGLSLADLFQSNDTGQSSSTQVTEFDSQILVGMWFGDLDRATNEYLTESVSLGMPRLAVSAASLVTVGYLTWMIRGGIVLSTFMSQTSAYSYFDIGALLDSATGRNESIESIVDQ